MSCLSDERLAALALGLPDDADSLHLAGCAACAARLARIEGVLRLGEAAHRTPLPGRPALDGEPPPALPSPLERFLMDRRTWAVAAIAAGLLLYLSLHGAPLALADALKPFKDAEAFACEAVILMDGKPADPNKKTVLKLAWTAPGSMRAETVIDGKTVLVVVGPLGKPVTVIDHKAKTIRRVGKPGAQETVVLRMVQGLASYPAGDAKPAGHDMIGGVRAARFDLVSKQFGTTWHYRLWADPKTKHPLRVDMAVQPDKKLDDKGVVAMRLEKFAWGKKAAGSFDAKAPPGYKVLEPKKDEK